MEPRGEMHGTLFVCCKEEVTWHSLSGSVQTASNVGHWSQRSSSICFIPDKQQQVQSILYQGSKDTLHKVPCPILHLAAGLGQEKK